METGHPPWKALRVRSSSLPRIRLSRRNSLNDREERNSINNESVGSGVRSWAKSWLSGNTSPTRHSAAPMNPADFEPPRRRRTSRRTPVLTLALLKLDEQILPYCASVCDPSYENIVKACALLDSTVAPASPCSGGSPSGFSGSPSSHRSSPSRSPVPSWMLGGLSASESPTHIASSAIALEGEVDRFLVPLFLLAGAEVVYASLGHARGSLVAQNLSGLYQRITQDLHVIRETLCDPFLGAEEEVVVPTLAIYYRRALSLATSLHALAAFCQIRCQMVQLQFRVWQANKPKFGDLARLYHDLLLNVPREAAHAGPMVNALLNEVKTWRYLLETAHSLERCRFSETIVNAQKTKRSLDYSSKICSQLWMRRTLQHLISILPIVFDKMEAFAKPLYGFQDSDVESSTLSPQTTECSKDLESIAFDFLRRQEKAGSPTTTVAVVVDAVKTSNMRIERGFAVVDSPTIDMVNTKETALFPAVYIRSTTTRGWPTTAPASGGLLSGMRRSSSRKDKVGRPGSRSHEDDAATTSNVSSSNILRSWSTDVSNSGGTNRKDKRLNVLEYEPECQSIAASWPHSAWKSLVALLTGEEELPVDPETEESNRSIFGRLDGASLRNLEVDLMSLPLPKWTGVGISNFSEDSMSPPPPFSNDRGSITQTSFHISALSDYMWLVVLVKVGEESRWHRKRPSRLVETEVQEFLDDFGTLLRAGDWFRASTALSLRREVLKANSSASTISHYACDLVDELKDECSWNDNDIHQLLRSLKEASRLRTPRSTLVEPLKSSYRRFRSIRTTLSPRLHRNIHSSPMPQPSLRMSSAAFFLGTELMHAVGGPD